MPSKKDMLKKAKRDARLYQSMVTAEVDPEVKTAYATTFEE